MPGRSDARCCRTRGARSESRWHSAMSEPTQGPTADHRPETVTAQKDHPMRPTRLAAAVMLALPVGLPAAPPAKPNVVYILADDLEGRQGSAEAAYEGEATMK